MRKDRSKCVDDCSDEFDYFSGRQKIKRNETKKRKEENNKKLFSFKIDIPKVKLPKVLNISKKEETLKDLVLNNQRHLKQENIYVSLDHLDHKNQKQKNKNVNTHKSKCVKCVFDDPRFTCACNSKTGSPDFQLYDGDVQFMYYNNAFFC